MPRGVPGSTPLCSLPGCSRPNCAKGLCRTHYTRQSRGLSLDDPIRRFVSPMRRRSHAPSLDARRLPGLRTSVCAACTMPVSVLVARWMRRYGEHMGLPRCLARFHDVIARHVS